MQRRVLPVLFATLMIDTIGFGMVIPILPILFTDPTSPSFLLPGTSSSVQYFVAGAITALWGLTQFIAAPILGEVSDAFGRKPPLLVGVGLLGFSQLLFGAGIWNRSVPLLFVARGLAGVSAGNLGIAQASVADITEPKDRARRFGLIGGAAGVGFILGPLLSGWIVQVIGNPALPFLVAGGLGLLNVLSLTLFLRETNTHPTAQRTFAPTKGIRNIQAALTDRAARRVYLTSFLYLFGFSVFTAFYGIFLVHQFGLNEGQVGTSFAVVGLCIVFTQFVILPALARRYAERILLRSTIVLAGASIGLSSFMPQALLFLAFIPLIAVPHALSLANLPALVSKSVSAERQGAALGINASCIALATGLAPIAMGVGSGLAGVHMPFLTATAFIGIAWCALFVRVGNGPAAG